MNLKETLPPWKVWCLNIPEWVSAHRRHHYKIYACLKNQVNFGQYYWDLRNFVRYDVNGGIMKPFHDQYLLSFLLFLTTISVHVMPSFGLIFGTSLHEFKQIFWDIHREIQELNYISMVLMIHWTIYNICQPYQKLSSVQVAWD